MEKINKNQVTIDNVNYEFDDMKPEQQAMVNHLVDLTEAEVIGWVQESLGKDTVEANVAAQIENQVNPTVVTPPLPWVSNTTLPV